MDRVMLYGKAGYASSNVDIKANSGSPVAGISAHTSSREDGWVIGRRHQVPSHAQIGIWN
jgi:hypothetical protein